MSKKNAQRLLDEVRDLPDQDKLKLVEELLFDLDGPIPVLDPAELDRVVKRRSAEVKVGTVKLLTPDDLKGLKASRRRR